MVIPIIFYVVNLVFPEQLNTTGENVQLRRIIHGNCQIALFCFEKKLRKGNEDIMKVFPVIQ